jgi:hypothetical protein
MSMPDIYFRVNQTKARSKDVDKWFYKFTDANGWGMPEEIDGPQTVGDLYEEPVKTEPTPEEVENMVSVIGTRQNISLTTLREDMKKKWSIGSTKAKEYIDRASQLGILTVSDNKYTANPVERFDNDNYKMPF